jgi:cytidylate kinase
MGEPGLTIAIDGVVGSGKTATARQVAAALGYCHLDTGAMYRAVALAAVRAGIAPGDTGALATLVANLRLEFGPGAAGTRVSLDGNDVTDEIRLPEISRRVGAYADVPLVRRALVARQQEMGRQGGVVAEGRDVGTVVFPQAELKVLMLADLAVRARRRQAELAAKGVDVQLEALTQDIARRDQEDAERDYGSAGRPADLVVIDTTDLTLQGQVDAIVALARARGA